jgi:hypothetical protein
MQFLARRRMKLHRIVTLTALLARFRRIRFIGLSGMLLRLPGTRVESPLNDEFEA